MKNQTLPSGCNIFSFCPLRHFVWHIKSDHFRKFTSKCLVELEHIAAWQLFFAIGDWNSLVKLLIFGQRSTSQRKIAFFRSKWFVLTLLIRFCTLCPFLRVGCVLNVQLIQSSVCALKVAFEKRLSCYFLHSCWVHEFLCALWIALSTMSCKKASLKCYVMIFHWSSL